MKRSAVGAAHAAASPYRRIQPARATGVLALGAAAAAVYFSARGADGFWRLHEDDPVMRSAAETAITLATLASTGLLLVRFRQTRLLRDLLMLTTLAAVSVTGFVFNALPAYGSGVGAYGEGARLALTMLIAATFSAVAFVSPSRHLRVHERSVAWAVGLSLGWVGFGEMIDVLFGPVSVGNAMGAFRPAGEAVALLAFVAFLSSAYGFLSGRRLVRGDARLLMVAALLLGARALATLSLPVIPARWVTPADALRLGAYLVLLAVSVRLYRRAQEQKAREAIIAERRRIARDLHDGLAQDLAFIAAQSERLAKHYGVDDPLAIAARRALAASRGQIVDLEASAAPTTEAALRALASEFGERYGVQVIVRAEELDEADSRPASERAELVRIAREATANAIRHGDAQQITITLGARAHDVMLRIVDDGRGLAASAAGTTAGTGLGLQTMRERARSLGAQLRVAGGDGGAEISIVAGRPGPGRR